MSYRLVTSHVKEELARMREDERKRALDEEIAFYEHFCLDVGIVVPCPICGLVMLDLGKETNHAVLCPECGLIG